MGGIGAMGVMRAILTYNASGAGTPVEPQGRLENARNRSARVRSGAFCGAGHKTENAILQWGKHPSCSCGRDASCQWGEHPIGRLS